MIALTPLAEVGRLVSSLTHVSCHCQPDFLGWVGIPIRGPPLNVAAHPQTQRLGFVTEQLSEHTNDAIGGLLNASFGNLTEVIISGERRGMSGLVDGA